jgi:hypothetical protein
LTCARDASEAAVPSSAALNTGLHAAPSGTLAESASDAAPLLRTSK